MVTAYTSEEENGTSNPEAPGSDAQVVIRPGADSMNTNDVLGTTGDGADRPQIGLDALEIFWAMEGRFSREACVTNALITDGDPHRYVAQLPSQPFSSLQIRPGRLCAHWVIHYLKLYRGLDSLRQDRDLKTLSSENHFEGLLIGRGISLLARTDNYEFVCIDEDPQLFLTLPFEDLQSGPLVLEIMVSVMNLAGQAKELGEHVSFLQQSVNKSEYECRRHQDELKALSQSEAALADKLVRQEAIVEQLEREFQAERQQLTEALREREVELRSIRGTLAWALVASIGKLKHGYLFPAARALGLKKSPEQDAPQPSVDAAEVRRTPTFRLWLGNLIDAALRRRAALTLIPGTDLVHLGEGNAWESVAGDPQFELDGILPRGWVKISARVEADQSEERSMLYLDAGDGYTERLRYDLGPINSTGTLYLNLGPEVERLRFDPIDRPGKFTVKKFTVRRISRLEAELCYTRVQPPRIVREAAEPEAPVLFKKAPQIDPYDAWLEVNEWNSRRDGILREQLRELSGPPLLSIIMPVYDPVIEDLNRAISSIVEQVYERWELCIADDNSTNPEVKELLSSWAARDSRIKPAYRPENGGISRATNTAAQLAAGSFLVFVDHDDEISPDALGEVALYLGRRPDSDVVYSDSDKIDPAGRRCAPEFKPDWSPELLLSYMYLTHLLVVRADLYRRLGGEREGLEGAQDYDLALRATEVARHIGHIPKVLYHWRAAPGSTALSGAAKPASFEAGRRAVQEAFDRRGLSAEAYQPDWALQAKCGIFSHRFPDDGPRVAIIIPTKNNGRVLRSCIESIRKTAYRNYELLIVDNASDQPETVEYLSKCGHRVVTIDSPNGRFNFAHINNRASREIDAEYILFLNDDTEVLSPGWLSQMAGYAGFAGVGAVGAKLVYPDGHIQHAGVVHGYCNGMAGHAFKLLPTAEHGYLAYTMTARNYSAVTAACMLTRRDLFLEVGGFDEDTFGVAYNDVDYCHRLIAAGYRVVYCPTAELIHREGVSRGFRDRAEERSAFRLKFQDFADPYYNPNLSLADEQFHIEARSAPAPVNKRIRSLMVGFNLNWEGAPYDQLEMTVGLRDLGVIEPVVYSPTEGPLRQQYEALGIEVQVHPHPLGSVMFTPEGYALGISSFAKWIEGLDVDLVYGNTLPTFYAIATARELGLPSIWNPRESEPWQTYFKSFGPYVSARALECFNYPYKVVFTANASERVYAPLNARRNFTTVHDGLDRAKFERVVSGWTRERARAALGVSEDEVLALTVGTVCERKGQLDLIGAMAALSNSDARRIRCFIVGDRPSDYSDAVRGARSKLSRIRQDRVTIVEECFDMALYYQAADMYLCASRVESFPRVILEAMAVGLPIITTPVYGIAEQVREGSNALFFQPGDVKVLAEHISALAADPKLRGEMGANSKLELDAIIDYRSMLAAYARVFQEAWLSGRPR
jgi:GT2 family glycosyltransferase/glycosyltransferase involved in cell wall biosynthesis